MASIAHYVTSPLHRSLSFISTASILLISVWSSCPHGNPHNHGFSGCSLRVSVHSGRRDAQVPSKFGFYASVDGCSLMAVLRAVRDRSLSAQKL